MNPIVRGAVAGTAGTILMSVPILAGQRLGLVRTAPPVEISANVARETDALPDPSRSAFSLLWPLSHLAYGAAGGVIYSLGRRFLPAPASTISAGLLFGGVVWSTAYLGFLPWLNLYPSPAHDARSRTVVMLVAHAGQGWSFRAPDSVRDKQNGIERRRK